MIFSEKLSIMVILDTSGSMGLAEKCLSNALLTRLLGDETSSHRFAKIYKILYHDRAEQSNGLDLFNWHANGGTRCSPAFVEALNVTQNLSPHEQSNLLIIHISDGDNERLDGPASLQLLLQLLHCCKHFAYIEMNTYHRKSSLTKTFADINNDRFSTHIIETTTQIDGCLQSIRRQVFKM